MSRNESVIKAFAVIEYLARTPDWVGIRKIAKDLDMDPATALRFLNSLKDLGYVKHHPENQGYQITLKFAWIASAVMGHIQLRTIARPIMKHLTAVTNETTHLSVLEGNEFVYIDKVDGEQAMRMRSSIGNRGYLHSTAAGKTLLAFLPKHERDEIVHSLRLTPLTKNTITDVQVLMTQLDEARSRGFSIDDEENELGIRCVGAPVLDHTGQVVAAVSLSGWTITMTRERLFQLAEELKKACLDISRELGYQPEIHFVIEKNV